MSAAPTSRGVELDLTARVIEQVDVFGAVGVTRARFKAGSRSSGVDVSDNTLPSTPGYTVMFGGEFAREMTPGRVALCPWRSGRATAGSSTTTGTPLVRTPTP